MKSKIEQKIEKAREATNEMFAAFEELNERLSEKEPEKWMPKVGEYYHTTGRLSGYKYIGICEDVREDFVIERVSLRIKDNELLFHYATSIDCWDFRPATPEEIALLDSKLTEQGKRFDKEKLELVDIEKEIASCSNCGNRASYDEFLHNNPCHSCNVIAVSKTSNWTQKLRPKHKEPIIGEMAIFWDTDKSMAFCAILIDKDNFRYHDNTSTWRNAILYESIEQYKAFLKS